MSLLQSAGSRWWEAVSACVPRAAIASGSTRASGARSSSSAAAAAALAFSAHTTTVGPEPDSVTPTWPVTGVSRSSPRSGASGARNGSCSRSWNASASSSASPEAMAAPSSAARAAASAASSCRMNSGRRERDSLVFTRDSGTTRIAASGRSSASRRVAWRLPSRQIRQTPPWSAAARLSAWPSSGSASSSTSSSESVVLGGHEARR